MPQPPLTKTYRSKPLPPPEVFSIDIEITERLYDRLQLAVKTEGITFNSFLERAILNAILETEKRTSTMTIYRTAVEFPYQCQHCDRRFKLPMHRARHVTHSHPNIESPDPRLIVPPESPPTVAPPTPDPFASLFPKEPPPERVVQPIPEPEPEIPEPNQPEPQSEVSWSQPELPFTLASGIDPALMAEFDAKLDGSYRPEPESEPEPPLFPPGDVPSLT